MPVNAACTVTALYSVITTGSGIPATWLDGLYGLGTNSLAESMDHDGDGHTTLQEWWADTNPTNAESVLAVTGLVFADEAVTIKWQGGVLATQYLEYSEDLPSSQGQWRVLLTNLPPAAVTGSYRHDGVTEHRRFYRLRAER